MESRHAYVNIFHRRLFYFSWLQNSFALKVAATTEIKSLQILVDLSRFSDKYI